MGAAVASVMRSPAALSPLAVIIGAGLGALVTFQPVSDTDLFWHLETGRHTLAGDLPRTDRFSWTLSGAPVFTDQWLGDLAIAVAHALGDWRGVLALRALAVAALIALVVDTALRARPGRPIVAALAALPAIALSRFAWTDRPELLALVCFALLVRLLRGGDRELLLSLPLLLIWSQLHGSYALGLGLILAVCASRATMEERDRWRYAPIAAFALLATLLTPAGLAAWTSSGGHFLAPPRFVEEEGVPDVRNLPGQLFVLTLALLIATAMLGRRTTLREIAILVPVTIVALTAARHAPLLAVAAAPYFASQWPDPLSRWRAEEQRSRATEGPRARGAPSPLEGRGSAREEGFGRAAAWILSAAVLALAVGLADAKVDERNFPRAALGALPSGPGVMNHYNWGGWLIHVRPATPVFIDGRLFPYVTAGVFDDYRHIQGAKPGWEDVVARRGVRVIFIGPNDPIAVRAPERGWRVAYRDEQAVILQR